MIKIIGNGLLARNMAHLKTDRDCLIIGAGVSNGGLKEQVQHLM